MIGTFSSLYLFTTDFLHRMQTGDLSWHSLGYIFILGVMGTSVANILYYRLVQKISPINASLVTFLMPLVALGWGWLDGEPLGFLHIASMLVILSGVYLVLLN
jgi:drug/metabolite transporter (DMT)-like permease